MLTYNYWKIFLEEIPYLKNNDFEDYFQKVMTIICLILSTPFLILFDIVLSPLYLIIIIVKFIERGDSM